MDATNNSKYDGINGPDLVDRIDRILAQRYHSRRQLADACGFSTTNIARWKTLGSIPDVICGAKMADFLHVPLYWLVTGRDEKGELSVDDYLFLEGFHSLDDEDKSVVLATMQALQKKYIKRGFEGHTIVD